jgi:hypothetical protein
MENENNDDIITSENNDEEVVDEVVEEETTEEAKEEVVEEKPKESNEAKKARLTRQLKKVNKDLGIVEDKPVAKKAPKVASDSDKLSQTDLIAIIKAEVPTEDIAEVTDYAELKGISVLEALKSSVVKTILKEKAEERNTAEATSTGASKRGSSKVSDDTLLSDYDKGKLPESEKDMDRLVRLQLKGDSAEA